MALFGDEGYGSFFLKVPIACLSNRVYFLGGRQVLWNTRIPQTYHFFYREKYDYEKENDAGRPCGTLRHILPRG